MTSLVIGPRRWGTGRHNEISFCVGSANPSAMDFGYWFDDNENRHPVDLGFDSSASLHDYTVV
jgi:hypothetical protein